MGINWISGSGVLGALGAIVAAGLVIEYWQVFALVILALVILHCLVRKPTTVSPAQAEANAEAVSEYAAILRKQRI